MSQIPTKTISYLTTQPYGLAGPAILPGTLVAFTRYWPSFPQQVRHKTQYR